MFMEGYLFEWFAVCSIMLMAIMSPGPDFVMAVRQSLLYSRRTGVLTALGFALGVIIHVTYSILGIAALIASSITLFNIMKIAGAAFLIFIGWKALTSKGFENNKKLKDIHQKKKDISALKALQIGFWTNVLNPKATLFFLALFTQVINPETPMAVQIVYGVSNFIITFLWFSFVAFVLTTPQIKARFLRFSKWIDRISGGLMIALGLRLLLTKHS